MTKHIVYLALSVALFTLARSLGDYKNTALGKAVAVSGGLFTLGFAAIVIRDFIARRRKPAVPQPMVLPPPIHTITFNYLPTSPLQSGQWTRAYGRQEPTFERDTEIAGGIRAVSI